MFKQKRKVRMYVQDGPTIEGVLAGRSRHEYIIWAPRLIEDDDRSRNSAPVKVSGHVEIPRDRVLWYQVIG